MKQAHFIYQEKEGFLERLRAYREESGKRAQGGRLFQVYSVLLDLAILQEVRDAIEAVFPEAPYIGCTTGGNLIDCEFSDGVVVVCTEFELPTTRFRVFWHDTEKNSVDEIAARILEDARENAWVKAVELFITIQKEVVTRFCEGLKELPGEVQIFGGMACSDDLDSDDSYIFAKGEGLSQTAVLVVFYGGEDFYVDSIKVTGWKPLGRKFRVTKSKGTLLQELDHIPAYEVYHKYLNINNDKDFFYNALEFPLFYEHNDTAILLAAVSSNEDGSISMSSDMSVGSVARVSYGDPSTIAESIRLDSKRIAQFGPDILHLYSCAARRIFWLGKDPSYEIQPFREIAPSCGFYSRGEFLRTGKNLNQHNVTLVIAAMREGERRPAAEFAAREPEKAARIPLASRLANFISVTSLELEKMNRQLANVNAKLKEAAILDGLTGLYNRKETERQIEEALRGIRKEKFSLIMLDIDNFKRVNDTYGHQEGDAVIIALADLLRSRRAGYQQNVSSGRWGGEEFMALVHSADADAAAYIADMIRERFAGVSFPAIPGQTVSLGVTQARPEDTVDSLCSRVDAALYQAKESGKNRVEVK